MATYDVPIYPTKRLRYFNNEFLNEQDFVDEQVYHVGHERAHLRALAVAGVCEGLGVTYSAASKQLSIAPGVAVDGSGQMIVLDAAAGGPALASLADGDYQLYVKFNEPPSDMTSGSSGAKDYRRWHQEPVIAAASSGSVPDGGVVIAAFSMKNGALVGNPSTVGRQWSGLRLPGPDPSAVTLSSRSDGNASGAVLKGSLLVRSDAGSGQLGPILTLMNGNSFPGGAGAGGAIDFDGYDPGAAQPTLRIQSLGDGAGSSHLAFSTKLPGAITNQLLEQMRLTSTGRLGLGTSTPQARLDVSDNARIGGSLDVVGLLSVNGIGGKNTLVLNDFRTVNPPSNVFLHSPPGDRDAWIYLDSADTSRNWGIYHRQIDAPVAGLPANSIAFIGGASSNLQAYVCLANGSASFAGSLALGGDLSIQGKSALRGSDPWLRLNPDQQFSSGVLTPGLLASSSLNVGGANGWSNPGAGNAWIAGALTVSGVINAPSGVIIEGAVGHIDRDGAFYRNTDGQCYLTIDDHLFIRRSGTGASWAAHFDTNAANLGFPNVLGDKIVIWDGGGVDRYGLGLNGGNINLFHHPGAHFSLRHGSANGLEFLTISGDGTSTTITSNARMHLNGGEVCYLLHKNGVIIGKEWNGTGDLTVEGAKHFRIDHPLDSANRYLMHAAIEGPEAGVYYRGEARLSDGSCRVTLPRYFEKLTRSEDRTVLLTPKLERGESVCALAAGDVVDGSFEVRAIDGNNPSQLFYWEVKAVRADIPPIRVESLKSEHPAPPTPPEARAPVATNRGRE